MDFEDLMDMFDSDISSQWSFSDDEDDRDGVTEFSFESTVARRLSYS